MAVADVWVQGVQGLSDEESKQFFDMQARRLLNMSGADFLGAYDAGKYPSPDDDPAVIQLLMLIPLVRH